MVKDLREKTGAGMMDCKKALVATDGDFEKAVDFLREKGMAKAAKKAGRATSEGWSPCPSPLTARLSPSLPCSARPISCPAAMTSRTS